ncbi:MAG: DUF255 domain-containing protein [Gemmataceae bacterium]|nr:DUF255 domain-containing protein [Gemmataceae bacterium]
MTRTLPAALVVALTAAVGLPADPPPKEKGKPNRLARESSPYLLQHAYNPVDWHPWGTEAFDRARKEGKLVFLSIGYSSCHWCHVMERESFSNPEVAKLLNAHFVCIKVDREERPDVDDVYMTALNVAGESGGWPLTMFLTPDGKPIFGGTYFPPDDRVVNGETVAGFKSILKKVVELDKTDRDGLFKQADRIAAATSDALERGARGLALVPLDRELVAEATGAFAIDTEHGGVGDPSRMFRHAKFPRAATWMFLLQQSRKPGNDVYRKAVATTLHKMAEGGIYDHLGGGFHRYSTERTWTVPHFEKMLYDNAQLAELYAEAFRLDPDPQYRRTVAGTLGFVGRELTSPEGAFYSALDADSNGKEGEFYVWTADEIKQVLGADGDVSFVRAVYGVAAPNFEEKFHILRLPKPTPELAAELKVTEEQLLVRLEPLRVKLFAHRAKRVRPFLDAKVITAWNGQMIAGYATAGAVFKNPEYTAVAAEAADFLLATMRTKDGRLLRTFAAVPGEKPAARGNGFLDDYAFLVHGLLCLHDATGEAKWLAAAKQLADLAVTWHMDAARGGFYYTAHDHEKLFARAKEAFDGAQPSANGVMARNLLRLWKKTGDAAYRDLCVRTVKAFAGTLKSNPGSVPSLARCLDDLLDATANDPAALDPKEPANPGAAKGPRASADVVKAALKASPPAADGTRELAVTLTVEKPWHVYAVPVENDTLKASETKVEVLANGKPVPGVSVAFPEGKLLKDDSGASYRVYEGTVTFTVKLPAGFPGEPDVRVRVIACKDGTCLLPSALKVT